MTMNEGGNPIVRYIKNSQAWRSSSGSPTRPQVARARWR